MVLVIGKENCGSCENAKSKLKESGVDFEYITIDKLNPHDKDKYMKMAREKKQMTMPLIVKENKLIDIEEA